MRLATGVAVAAIGVAICVPSQAEPMADALRDAAFAPRTTAQTVDPGARFIEHDSFARGGGPLVWRSGEVRLAPAAGSGAVDTLRVNLGAALQGPGGLPIAPARGRLDPSALDVTLIRSWPDALSLGAGALQFAVSPHAGVGLSTDGGQAEAGATLRISPTREDRAVARLKAMGVADGAEFGRAGRWYFFAAASGRAVGLNMLRDGGRWGRGGWSTDATGGLVGDAQIGVGWRKGDIQSSFGVIHREVRGQHMIFGQQTRDDTVAAISFSIKP